MVFVTTQPQVLPAVAGNPAGIGFAMAAGNSAAAGLTAEAIPVAPYPASALIAAKFAAHARTYPAMDASPAVFGHVGGQLGLGCGYRAGSAVAASKRDRDVILREAN